MRLFSWLQVVIGKAEKGIWYDSDDREFDPTGYGLVVKLWGGWIFRPMPKPQYWLRVIKGDPTVPDSWDQFSPDYHWMIKFWLPVVPYFSLALGQLGVYFGFKTFSFENERYRSWGIPADAGFGLTPSVSTRTTRWD